MALAKDIPLGNGRREIKQINKQTISLQGGKYRYETIISNYSILSIRFLCCTSNSSNRNHRYVAANIGEQNFRQQKEAEKQGDRKLYVVNRIGCDFNTGNRHWQPWV